eukprot:4496920-Pyramimonas_sp.AAC.1
MRGDVPEALHAHHVDHRAALLQDRLVGFVRPVVEPRLQAEVYADVEVRWPQVLAVLLFCLLPVGCARYSRGGRC